MLKSNTYNDERYYSEFKKIRNQFRKYHSNSIIHGCINYIYTPVNEELGDCRKMPWLVMLLIKWVLLDENHNSNRRKLIDSQQLWKILNSIHHMAEYVRMPDEYSHYTLFFRNIAYQQFIYQRQISLNHLSRQYVLFSDLQKNNLIRSKFIKLTGVEINEFLELSVAIIVHFISGNEKTLPSTWFNTLTHHYSTDVINNYYKCISSNISEIKNTLLKKDNGRRSAEEYYEQTPFQKFPIIIDGREFLCIHPMVLFRRLENYVYDKLREWDSEKFMNKFGSMFEKYVERTINYSGVEYVDEKTLKEHLDITRNIVDFLVTEKNANIFIDAKGVEMADKGKITHSANIIKDKTKNSIIKAIHQSYDVLNQIQKLDTDHPIISNKKKNYIIVVTFKELYLGNGINFYKAIAKRKLDEIEEKFKPTSIPKENMFFLTIEEFDLFFELIKNKTTGIVEGLEKAKSDDNNPCSSKFDFMQHLFSMGCNNTAPKYIKDNIAMLFNKIGDIILKKC